MVFSRFLKFSFLIVALFSISHLVYGQTSASHGTFISSDEFIKQLRETGQLGVFDTPAADLFQDLCPKCIKRGSATDDLRFLCETVTTSSACEAVEKEDRLDCSNPSQSKEFDTIDFFAGCAVGLFDSVTELLSFIWDVLEWVWEKGTHPSDTYQEASEYAESVKLYLTTEYDKAYDQVSSPFKSVKAAKAVAGKIAERLFNTIQQALYTEYLEFGCLNFRARMEMMCKLAGEFIIPPAAAFALLKKGPAAAAAVAARSGKAVSKGKKGKAQAADGAIEPGSTTIRARGNKVHITFMKDGKKYTKSVELDTFNDGRSDIKIGDSDGDRIRIDFVDKNGKETHQWIDVNEDAQVLSITPGTKGSGTASSSRAAPADNAASSPSVAPGETVSVPRSRGGFSEAKVEEVFEDGRARVTFEEGGEKFEKTVPIESLQRPSTPSASGVTSSSVVPGETVSVSRSRGGFSEAKVEEVFEDGRARVTFEENGEKYQKIVPIESLQRPSAPSASGVTSPRATPADRTASPSVAPGATSPSRGFERGEIWYDSKIYDPDTRERFPRDTITSTKEGKMHIDYTHKESVTGKSVTFKSRDGGQFKGVIRGMGGNNGEGGVTFFIIKFRDGNSIKEDVIGIEDIDFSQ